MISPLAAQVETGENWVFGTSKTGEIGMSVDCRYYVGITTVVILTSDQPRIGGDQ
ncbi:hypothetical protein ACM25N_08530 [Roseovarius sp. C7]|uniref:hypothetical protein n=1 Tax=Roseovarius sp. C7 TaxID=3398643 RepID=UPI0039F7055C